MTEGTVIDLFCGAGGWTDGFLEKGFRVIGYDLKKYPNYHGEFVMRDILDMTAEDLREADFVVASSPCEQFSVHGMPHFHPNPKYPELGIKLFGAYAAHLRRIRQAVCHGERQVSAEVCRAGSEPLRAVLSVGECSAGSNAKRELCVTQETAHLRGRHARPKLPAMFRQGQQERNGE